MNLTTENQPAQPQPSRGHQLGLWWVYLAGEILTPPVPLAIPESGCELGRGNATMPGQITDPKLSRSHAELAWGASGTLCIRDHASRNGTFVNGSAIREQELKAGDVVRIGNSLLVVEPVHMGESPSAIPGLLGNAASMHELRRRIHRVAASEHTVLLSGESGSGKSLVACLLHERSGRSGRLITVGCGEIPEAVLAARLFGQVAGAFPGAGASPGFFQEAQDGTLFLDEVSDLSGGGQAMLRNAIVDKRVTPLGSSAPVQCKVRVIASTQHDLSALVMAGRFRSDLYARLSELLLQVPPLRQRRLDILDQVRLAPAAQGAKLAPDLAEQLLLYSWPLNVRELLALTARLQVASAGAPVWELAHWAEHAAVARPSQAPPAEKPVSAAVESARPAASPAVESPAQPGLASQDVARLLTRKGEMWSLTWQNKEYLLADSKGYHFLHCLLIHPNRAFGVSELLELTDPSSSGEELQIRKEAKVRSLGSTLDAKAMQQYKQRLADLVEGIEEAKRFNDYQRVERLSTEREQIMTALQRALGKGGRPRLLGRQAERDRVNIQRCIRRAIDCIQTHAPPLAKYLESTIHTGLNCVYRPLPHL